MQTKFGFIYIYKLSNYYYIKYDSLFRRNWLYHHILCLYMCNGYRTEWAIEKFLFISSYPICFVSVYILINKANFSLKKNPIRFSFLGMMVELIIRPNLTINLVTRISFIDLVRGRVKNNPNEKTIKHKILHYWKFYKDSF